MPPLALYSSTMAVYSWLNDRNTWANFQVKINRFLLGGTGKILLKKNGHGKSGNYVKIREKINHMTSDAQHQVI